MGHLINPIAFRLGHTRSWEDNWYVKNIYYPEFLHSILKIRYYIHYYWTTRFIEKKGFLLSHFNIYKNFKNILIKIFLYNMDFEIFVYSFYARGFSVFSDSFYFRYSKQGKKKEPFCYERYKPDLFFSLFLYFIYFSNEKVERRANTKFPYYFSLKKNKKKNLKLVNLKKYNDLNANIYKRRYLNYLKEGDLSPFFKFLKGNNLEQRKKYLKITAYEDKIKEVNSKTLNMGFLDYLTYLFFKINMLNKKEDYLVRIKKRKKKVEMILNYPLKIRRWIVLLKRFTITHIKLSSKVKRSIKNFIFFLNFLMNMLNKVSRGYSKYRLRELNLRLIRLFLINSPLTDIAVFYGEFLSCILGILTKMDNFKFKFCFITNKNINARFLSRYIGLKLKRKFPLFYVINPLKKELKKLSRKNKTKKKNLWFDLYDNKQKKLVSEYKKNFKSILLYLYNKYLEKSFYYYSINKTLITINYYIYILLIKNNYNNYFHFKRKKWRNRNLNKRWYIYLISIIKKRKKNYYFNKLKIINLLFYFLKNKFLIHLLFGQNKYHIDFLALKYFSVKGYNDIFFFLNSNYSLLVIYSFFYNYNFLNINNLYKVESNYFNTSLYLLNTYLYYLYAQYNFTKLIDYLKINKRKYYLKTKKMHEPKSFLLGYKMSFKGRFTRKQRASSIWFHQGFVPLNTIKGHVDYSFFTIPLKNSAVSIKLWLYKSTNQINWNYKFLSKL